MNVGQTTADAFNRMNLIIAQYELVIIHLHEMSSEITSYVDSRSMNQIFKYAYDNYRIWCGIKSLIFKIINEGDNLKPMKGGQTGGMHGSFLILCLLILLAIASLNSSTQIATTNNNDDVAKTFEMIHSSAEKHGNRGLSVKVVEQRFVLGFPLPNIYSEEFLKLIANHTIVMSDKIRKIQQNCRGAVKHNPGQVDLQYESKFDGTIELASSQINPPNLRIPVTACTMIPPEFFKYNKQTGEIEYIANEFTLSQITSILGGVASNMEIVISEKLNPTTNDFINAYNKLVFIINSLTEIDILVNLQGIPEIVSNQDIPTTNRVSALRDYLNAIATIATAAAEATSKNNLASHLQSLDARKDAEEAHDLEMDKARTEEINRHSRKIASLAIQANSKAAMQNIFNEYAAPVATLGSSVSNSTIGLANEVTRTAAEVLFSPLNMVDVGLKRIKGLIFGNAFILILALIAAGAAATVMIYISPTGIVKVVLTNTVKFFLLPVTIPYKIGKYVFNLMFYTQEPAVVPVSELTKQAAIDERNQLLAEFKKIDADLGENIIRNPMLLGRKDKIAERVSELTKFLKNARGITRRVKHTKKRLTKNKKRLFRKHINSKKKGKKTYTK